MHGYDIHGQPDHIPHHHPHHPIHAMQQQMAGPQPHMGAPMDMGMMGPGLHHPHQQQAQHPHDPSDAFVQFLDSDDDSMHHDGQSP